MHNIDLTLLTDRELLNLESHLKSPPTVQDFLAKKMDLSYLKKLNCGMAANGELFSNDRQSFLSSIMSNFMDWRKEAKSKAIELKKQKEKLDKNDKSLDKQIAKFETKQMAYKIAANSGYGAIGQVNFRHYDVRQAEAITISGQLAIQWVEKYVNEYFNKICKTSGVDYIEYLDTDSLYISASRIVDSIFGPIADPVKATNTLDKISKEVIQPFMDKCYKELAEYMNCYTNKMVMKRENICSKGIWVAKKRYCLNVIDSEGVRYAEPKLKIMGIEVQRSSTPNICREALKKCIKIMLTGTEDELIKYVTEFKNDFMTRPYIDIASPRGVNDLEKYTDDKEIFSKGTPIAVKGALIYNNLIESNKLQSRYQKIDSGDKIKFIYLKVPNPTKSHVISFVKDIPEEFKLQRYIDKETQYEKTFLDPLNGLLNTINWNYEVRNSVSDFFE